MRVVLGSLVRWALVGAVLAAFSALALVTAPFTTPRRLFPVTRRLLQLLVRAAGLRVEVQGTERLTPGTGYVYMINHVSFLDHFVLGSRVPEFVVGLEKASNFRIPVYGRLTRWWGNIPVVREDREKALAAVDRAKDCLHAGTSIAIAPEGTRGRTGALGPLKKGGFHLALETGAPIVPVALLGMRERNPDRVFRIVPGPVRLVFLAPIAHTAADTAEGLAERVREALHAAGVPRAA